MGLFSFFSKKKSKTDKDCIRIISNLEALGYFKYTNKSNLDKVKQEIKAAFKSSNVLSTFFDDTTHMPLDYRLYFCDGEDLFEIGGIVDYLNIAKHAFDQRGLSLDWENEISEEKDLHWNHRITVNGKEYIAFEGNMRSGVAWGVAQMNFYKLLNDQLETQGSLERVYPISGGEEGQFTFLTEEQYAFISKNLFNGKEFRVWEKIYPLNQWIEANGLLDQ